MDVTPPARSAEAFEGSVCGDTDYLSILSPETGLTAHITRGIGGGVQCAHG